MNLVQCVGYATMSSKTIIQISVRNLVEYVYRQGDISLGYFGRSRMVEGTKAHQKVQKSRGKDYKKEVSISNSVDRRGTLLKLRGRIDGILEKHGLTVIEEIKSTSGRLANLTEESNQVYWAQAKFYAYFYAVQNKIKKIGIQLTYYQIDQNKTKLFFKEFTFKELESFCLEIMDKYLDWAIILSNWLEQRNDSRVNLHFPFTSYRKGQDKMVKIVKEVIENEKKLFCQAPTGIGKTIGALYPSIKSMGSNFDSKIFYLTAKTTTRFIAEETLEILRDSGLKLKSTTITAKAKICFKDEVLCDPNYCEYANGHFDRINDAVKDIFQENAFSQKIIEKYAQKHQVCPFEFSLDLTNWSDCIICDYNYVFDPRVYLKRYFLEDKGDFIFLIDEAHNLVDRARKMYSAELTKKPILDLSRATKEDIPELSKILNSLNRYFIVIRKECELFDKKYFVQKELLDDTLFKILRKFSAVTTDWLEKNIPTDFREELVEFYFDARSFLRVAEDYDSRYITYIRKYGNNVKIKLFCLDPSFLLKEALNRGNSAVFYSATLTPLDYFSDLLGGDKSSTKLQLPSPFPKENLCLMLADTLSTRYVDRESSYEDIADWIKEVIKAKTGNYLVYFPSYEYMRAILANFEIKSKSFEILEQQQGMTEEEREVFLNKFSSYGKKTLVGFAVMGGIFSEGIDLIGEKLSGAIIVGVGLPKVNLERDMIRNYFDNLRSKGFLFAYTYPGMNKVLQAAGRVIRTEEDRGVVLLIGDRYSTRTYSVLFPEAWSEVQRVYDNLSLSTIVKDFWKK